MPITLPFCNSILPKDKNQVNVSNGYEVIKKYGSQLCRSFFIKYHTCPKTELDGYPLRDKC